MPSEGNARTSMLAVAVPTILGSLLYTLVGFVSIGAVSRLGMDAVASVLAADRALITSQAVLLIPTAAVTALVAQNWGAERFEDAASAAKLCLLLGVGVGLGLTLATWLLIQPLASLFGLAPSAREGFSRFLLIASAFNLAAAPALVLAAALRAAGDALAPLLAFGAANLVNIALLAILVGGYGPVPPLGVAGAAFAYGMAYVLALAIMLAGWRAGRLRLPWPSGPFLDLQTMRTALGIGWPAAAQQSVMHLGLFATMVLVARYGASALVAYGVGVNLMAVAFIFGGGFATAAATLVGQNIGAGRLPEARAAAWRALGFAAAFMSVFGLAIYLLGLPIGRLLGLDAAALADLRVLLLVLAAVQPLMAVESSLSGALRGAGDNMTAMKIGLAGLFGGRLLLALLFWAAGLEVGWVFAAIAIDYALKAVLYLLRFRGNAWAKPVIAGVAGG